MRWLTLTPFDLALLALATWRVSYMLVLETGPFKAFVHLRNATKLGGLLECVFCMSVWVAIGLYALWGYSQWPIYVLAVSAGALIIDRIVSG